MCISNMMVEVVRSRISDPTAKAHGEEGSNPILDMLTRSHKGWNRCYAVNKFIFTNSKALAKNKQPNFNNWILIKVIKSPIDNKNSQFFTDDK